jgi:hypothetical protein
MKLQPNNRFTLSLEEKLLIQELRIWSNNVFAPKFVYPTTMFDACAIVSKQARECDLHCKIIEVKSENDMFCEICLNDTSGCKLFLRGSQNNMKQWEVEEGDIVRVRSIQAVKGTSNYIELTKSSHFIKFPKNSRVYHDIEARMKDDQLIFKMMNNPLDEVILDHPITVSRTSERYNSLDLVSLYDLFHNRDSKHYAYKYTNYYDEYTNPLQSRFLRMRLNVLRFDPPKVEEFVQMYCEKCNATSSLQNLGEGGNFYS